MLRYQHLIGGQPHGSEHWLEVADPARGLAYAEVADGSAGDVHAAVEAASGAFPEWSGWPAERRARCLERLADAVEARLDDFAHAEARDGGKPFALARDAEIPRAIANLRFFAHAATQFASECHHGQAGLNYTLRLPLGAEAVERLADRVGIVDAWVNDGLTDAVGLYREALRELG